MDSNLTAISRASALDQGPAAGMANATAGGVPEGETQIIERPPSKAPGSGMVVFGRYKLDRVLGRGGMGVVWLAEDQKLERPVALKFLPSLIGIDPAAVKELKTETRRGLELSHPNIVRIYDFVDDEDAAAISMEFVDGKTLSELRMSTDAGVFSVAEISQWLPGVCDALDYAHFHRQLVHRDLKPANIMVNSQGVAKIADFGIARSLADTMSRLSAAHIGGSGTLPYMSPQQAMGERPVPTDDVYSLAATVYEMVAGKPPFYRGDLPTQITAKVPPSMQERRAELEIRAADEIPSEWEAAIASALHKDPSMRPQSAGALAEMLGIRAQGSPAWTSTHATAAVVRRRASRLPRHTAAGVIGAGLAAAAIIWWAAEANRVRSVRAGASPAGAAVPNEGQAVRPEQGKGQAQANAAAGGQTGAISESGGSLPTVESGDPVPDRAVAGSSAAALPLVPGTSLGPALANPPGVPPLVALAPTSGIPAASPAAPMGLAAAPSPDRTAVPGDPLPERGGAETEPPAPVPAGPPLVVPPPAGYWEIEQMFPNPPFAAFSTKGKRHVLFRVQEVLKQKGLYTASLDGKQGRSTHNAVVLFQSREELPAHGLLDLPTLAALGLDEEIDRVDWNPPADSTPVRRRRAPAPEKPNLLDRVKKIFK